MGGAEKTPQSLELILSHKLLVDPDEFLAFVRYFVPVLFVSQTFIHTDTGCPTGRDPTGKDRKHDDNPEPDPNAVSGREIFSREVDHLSQRKDKRGTSAESDG